MTCTNCGFDLESGYQSSDNLNLCQTCAEYDKQDGGHMITCDNCEEAKAVRYNDGDRVCGACSDIIDGLRKTNPELWQAGECIRCGADKCSDALCKEEVLREQEAQDGEDDRTTFDMSDDADALASAGWGTDEDYGYYGDE